MATEDDYNERCLGCGNPPIGLNHCEMCAMQEVVTAVRADLARYRDDYPNGTRFALTERALQYLEKQQSTAG